MKKIFKKIQLKNLIFTILVLITGVVIGGIVGVTATTNKLEAKYVMYTKDGKTMTVQDAIKDLYVLAKNNGGSVTNLALTPEVSGSNISIAYTGTYTDVKCVYGTDEKYGNVGKIEGNKCTILGMPNVTYYYKITTLNNTGEIYSGSGSSTTRVGATIVTSELPTGVKAIVYLDPTNLGATCNASNSTIGSGTSGCMKWYAFSEDNTSYTMILDHNTTSKVAWNSSNVNTSMGDELKKAINDLVTTTKWKVTPRLIHAQEVANITKNASWTASLGNQFYLDNNTASCANNATCSTGASKYYWLFDYTWNCTSCGCKADDSNSNNMAFWTDTPVAGESRLVWNVHWNGTLHATLNANNNYSGVRPVITVQKSNF